MLVSSDNSTSPSLWLWVLSLAYRTMHGILVIGLPILLVIGLVFAYIYFINYGAMAKSPSAPGEPGTSGQDGTGQDSKILKNY